MPAATEAPKASSQPSRRGKKAWRKNVDITPITDSLAITRDEAIQTGGKTYADLPSDVLFQTDKSGAQESDVRERLFKSKGHAPLKADQIIGARSKIAPVGTHQRPGEVQTDTASKSADGLVPSKRRRNGVSRAEYEKLKRFAYTGGQATEQDIVQTGEAASYDPWLQLDSGSKRKHQQSSQSVLSAGKAIREPSTLRQAPRQLTSTGKSVPNLRKPAAGRSYNPAFSDWKLLISRAGEKEVEKERRRLLELRKESDRQARAQSLRELLDREEHVAEKSGLSDYDSEWDGFPGEPDDERSQMLETHRPRRKTPAERNRAKRKKGDEARARHEQKARERERQERRLAEIIKQTQREDRQSGQIQEWEGFESEEDSPDDAEAEDGVLKKVKFTRNNAIPKANLDVVLPDELQDSLRMLKPEGSILRDRFRNMVLQGKMEARKPIFQSKKPRREVTEKWSYKDWQPPRSMK